MSTLTVRVPIHPTLLLTLVATTFLLYAAYLIAPASIRDALLICAGLMVVVVAFSSVELTLYLLILSTLLSPELQFGGSVDTEGATTASRGVTLRVDDLILTVICLTWMFRMAARKELGLMRKTPINQPIAWYWLATLVATIIGFYNDRVGAYGFFFVVKYLEYFVLFYMIINQVHDEAAIKRYIIVMLFTCFVVSILGIVEIPSGGRVSAPFEGDIGEPNTFGGYLVLMFGVTLGLFLNEVRGKKKWQLAGLMVLIIVPLAFTESRSSYLAFITMIGLFIVFSQHKRILIVFCLVGIMLTPFVIPKNVVNRMAFTFGQAKEAGQFQVGGVRIDTSTSARLQAWGKVLAQDFFKHPLLGVGVTGGQFLDAQYPRVLLETGFIGLFLFLWLLRRMWVLLRVCHRHLSDPGLRGVALGTLCGFGGLLVHALGSNSFIIVRIMEPFMILMGLLLTALLIENKKFGESLPEKGFA